MRVIGRTFNSPLTSLIIGVVLIITAGLEIWVAIQQDMANLQAQAHHGVFVYGIYTALKALIDLSQSVESLRGRVRGL